MRRSVAVAGKRKPLRDVGCLLLVVVLVVMLITTRPSRYRRFGHSNSISHAHNHDVAMNGEWHDDDDIGVGGGSDSSKAHAWRQRRSIWHHRLGDMHYLNGSRFAADPVTMDQFVVIVVNVASHCGFTELNYRELTKMDLELRVGRGLPLRILAFPCNQFGGQEGDAPEVIQQFAVKTHHAAFDLMERVDVNGDGAPKLFRKLKKFAKIDVVPWNFGKFVIGKGGQVRGFFDHRFPFDVLRHEIEAALLDGTDAPSGGGSTASSIV